MNILIIEDNWELAASIQSYIALGDYFSEIASSYQQALEVLHLKHFDCALVDLMLPDGDGLHLVQTIKQIQVKCGIIIISAKDEINDKILGLNAGADDYIAKPFNLGELNARINSVIRRTCFDGQSRITIKNLIIDLNTREAFVEDNLIDLTKREFDILVLLISNKNRVLTKEAIIEYVWGEDSNTFSELDFIYTHIRNVRKKITEKGAPDFITSIYGIGYKFTDL